MSQEQAEKILSGMNQVQKKELLDTLAGSLFSNFSESEKKEFLQRVISGDKANLPLIEMVEH